MTDIPSNQLQVKIPMYLVQVWTGTFGPDNAPIVRPAGLFPTLGHAISAIQQNKWPSWSMQLIIELDQQNMPLQGSPGPAIIG
jgi:hypothetical protein